MRILVLGGTGTVGSQVVRALLALNHSVRVLTRSAEKAGTLPAGVEPAIGDLAEPATIRSVFQGMEAVFLLNAVTPLEAHEGLMAVNGAMLAGVRRLVYLSVHHADRAPHLPHFGAKLPIEAAVKASGIPWTILRPNNFFQNDYWYKDAILKYGVYPQPIGSQGLSRVDVRDIAAAAVIALTTDTHAGQVYNLVGPDLLTGPATAEIWSEVLGRPVRYGGEDMDEWERQAIAAGLPPALAFDFRRMYEFFQQEGLKATPHDVDRQTRLLGHAPRRFVDFVKETALEWR
ncbi:MAG: SDR family oxidoreductase [Gemmatimonadota bacterium]